MAKIEQIRVFIHPDGRLDRKNAARYTGFSPKTLADWATRGIGPRFTKVGGRVFYNKDDLDEWIRHGNRQTKQPRSSVRGSNEQPHWKAQS